MNFSYESVKENNTYKESGVGLDHYTETKTTWIDLN